MAIYLTRPHASFFHKVICVMTLFALIQLYLLCIVGCVGQHGGHMEHNLIVLVAGVEGMRPRGVSCAKKKREKHVMQRSHIFG